MAEYYRQGNAIEGDKVSGTSRKELICRGRTVYRGRTCTRWSAHFNVTSQIDSISKPGEQFDSDAIRELGSSLKCDRAMIHTQDKKPSNSVEHGSHTHKTNAWRFSGLTNVLIENPHQTLEDAAQKREQSPLTLAGRNTT